jgi:thioredoxin-like negative regulator of GroEL
MLRRIGFSLILLVLTAFSANAADIRPYEAARFEKAVASGNTVIAHVHADWCPVCKRQQNALAPLADGPLDGKADFFRVDFDSDNDFLQAHRVPSQSVIIIFKGGKEVDRLVGTTDAAEIEARLSAAVS